MTSRPPVSVVIIFLDEERFLAEAVNSVFAQTYDRWELLLVDDGSTDDSRGLARRLAAAHPGRVRYLEHAGHRNRGMSASRNLGVRHATGEYVAFLDADDVWRPGLLEEQVAILETCPEAGMVYGPIQYWHSWTGNPKDLARDWIEPLGVPASTLVRPPALLPLFLQGKAAVPSGFLVRHEVIGRVGGFEETFRGEYEDQVFCAKVSLEIPLFASGECGYQYRQHPESCVAMGERTGHTRIARRVFLEWLEAYLIARRVTHPGVWQAVRGEFIAYRHPALHRLRAGAQGLLRRTVKLLRRVGLGANR